MQHLVNIGGQKVSIGEYVARFNWDVTKFPHKNNRPPRLLEMIRLAAGKIDSELKGYNSQYQELKVVTNANARKVRFRVEGWGDRLRLVLSLSLSLCLSYSLSACLPPSLPPSPSLSLFLSLSPHPPTPPLTRILIPITTNTTNTRAKATS